MSRLDELIRELCPDGVEYKRLGEVTLYASERISATELTSDNYVGVENLLQDKQGKTKSNYVPKDGRFVRFISDDILIGNIRPYLKKIWLSNCEGGTNGDVLAIRINSTEQICPKFLFYILSSDEFFVYDMQNSKGAKMPRGDKSAIMNYLIPVPPLEVQREIVRILDNFTELTVELEEKLATELAARKRQYEYYRNKLFEQKRICVDKVPISSLGTWRGGKTPSMTNKDFWDNGTVPWISSKDMKTSVLKDTEDHITEKALSEGGMTLLPKNAVAIVTRSGILKHTFPIAYVPFQTTVNQDIKALVVRDGVLPKYAFHVLQAYSENIRKKTKKQGGTVDSLDFQKVLNYEVPLPTMDIQERLVEVLDNFEAICSDLNIGLPAEIEARQKQYEYYRDKLLTFDISEITICRLDSTRLDSTRLDSDWID